MANLNPSTIIAPDMSDEEAVNAAQRILCEFQNSRMECDLRDKMQSVGENNHPRIIHKMISLVCSSVAQQQERILVATLLSHLLAEDVYDDEDVQDEDSLRAPLVKLQAVVDGFRGFFEEALGLRLVEDNPKIWVCFADLMTHCFTQQTFTYLSLNRLIPSSLMSSDQMIPMTIELYKRLKQEPDHHVICCTGHFDLLQRLFAENKDTVKIDAFLQALEEAGCIEVDVSFYVYHAFKTNTPQDQILKWLQKRIPFSMADSPVVTQKIVAPAILYSAVATNLFTTSENMEPKEFFERLLTVFRERVMRPILKYTQNESPKWKLNNELHCLLEAQRFCFLTSFQPGVLCNVFQVFYELEIVSEDTYFLWRMYDSSLWGRDVAQRDVQEFLAFLENGDGDDEEPVLPNSVGSGR